MPRHPRSDLPAAVLAALEELGLDVGQEFPKPLTDAVVRAGDRLITIGCGDACPSYPA